jgi:glycosyltransferase involved in cell wall biosynthesis
LEWSTHFAVKKAKKIIAISNFTKKDLIDLYKAKSEKISVIYNGYNRYLFDNIDEEKIDDILEKYGLEKPFLFYIGRIERKKNIPLLIEAFAIYKEQNTASDLKLVLAGDASYGYDEINYTINEFDMVEDVIMPGWVEEEDVPYIFKAAAAFIFPSNYEGFGIPLLQAMAAGTPIAAADRTSIPEVVGDAALLFNPEHALSIAEAIKEIVHNQELRTRLIARGHERAKNFSWEKTARETLDLLNSF